MLAPRDVSACGPGWVPKARGDSLGRAGAQSKLGDTRVELHQVNLRLPTGHGFEPPVVLVCQETRLHPARPLRAGLCALAVIRPGRPWTRCTTFLVANPHGNRFDTLQRGT